MKDERRKTKDERPKSLIAGIGLPPRQLLITNYQLPIRRLAAFTLIELIVVMGIIVLVLSLALPAINKLMQGSKTKQSVNMISAYVASGRAAALQYRRPVAVIFFEDVTNNYGGQTAVQLAREVLVDPSNPNVSYFSPLPARPTEYLPVGVKLAAFNDNLAMSTPSLQTLQTEAVSGQAATCRAILFDQNGVMSLRDGLGTFNATTLSGLSNIAQAGSVANGDPQWQFNATATSEAGPAGSVMNESSPGFIVYDGTEFANWINNLTASPTPQAVSSWIQEHGDILVFNGYSGSVIRYGQ